MTALHLVWFNNKMHTLMFTGWAKKLGHRLLAIILSNLNRLKNSLEDSWVNLELKGY